MSDEKALESRAVASLGLGQLRPGTVAVTVDEGIAAKSLHELLDRVIGLHGCTTCGLSGIDLRFRVRDRLIFERFKDIPGVADVAVIR